MKFKKLLTMVIGAAIIFQASTLNLSKDEQIAKVSEASTEITKATDTLTEFPKTYTEAEDDAVSVIASGGCGEREAINFYNLTNTKDFSAAGYTDNVLLLDGSSGVSIGSVYALDYNGIRISYGSDASAPIGEHKIYLCTADGTVLGSAQLSQAEASWSNGQRDVIILFDADYNGELFLKKDEPGHSIAIDKIDLCYTKYANWSLSSDGELTITPIFSMDDFDTLQSPWYAYRHLIKKITIGKNNSNIGAYTFNVGAYAFSGCENLTTVVIGGGSMSISEGAFYNCPNITNVYVGSSQDEWNEVEVGANNDSLLNAKFTFNSASETIAWRVDNGDTLVISGTGDMPDYSFNATPWYESRFSIKNVIIERGITSISDYCFYDFLNVTNITISDTVTSIGEASFGACRALKSVTIPQSVTSIATRAFSGCNSLSDVYYDGTEYEWNLIAIAADNNSLLNANMHFYKFIPEFPGEIADPTFAPKLTQGQILEDIGAMYSEYQTFVFDHDGNLITKDGMPAKTGYTAVIVNNRTIVHTLIVVVEGDATGDGVVNGKDLIRLKKQIKEGNAVKYSEFADFNNDGVVDDSDVEYLMSIM